MSSRYWELLWKRAKRFLIRAERDYSEGDYDGACFNSEQAIQLAAKAVLYRLFGVKVRIPSSKALLAQLRDMLYGAGKQDLAKHVDNIVSSHSRELELLEESYIGGRYGEFEYFENQGKACIEVAKKVLESLIRIEYELTKTSG
jgi:HEPN domain-containing protein